MKGLYLVVDQALDPSLSATRLALSEGVNIVQLLGGRDDVLEYAKELRSLTTTSGIPFLVNNNIDLARRVEADGVHIDSGHPNPDEVRQVLGEDSVVGYTCGDNLGKVHWAWNMGADYVSFCSIFPSGTAGECEIVPLETVARARKETLIPIFAAGGITHENAAQVLSTGIDGLAVVSAILSASDPRGSARRFNQIIEDGRVVSLKQ